MYEKLAQEYVLDETNQEFMKDANPWALRSIIERLHEAAERELWEEPDPEVIAAMQQVYRDLEGDIADRQCHQVQLGTPVDHAEQDHRYRLAPHPPNQPGRRPPT